MATIPQNFPQETKPQAQYDYYNSILGVGFVKFYLATTKDSVGDKYILTLDSSLISHLDNYIITDKTDIDFDIDVEIPFIISGQKAIVSYYATTSDSATRTITWTVYHVDSNGTETSIGSVISDGFSSLTTGKLTHNIDLTRKEFRTGDKLRLNAQPSNTNVTFHADPSGLNSSNETPGDRAVTSQSFISIPIVRPV